MNKKGFVLMETLVVTVFTMFIFTVLYNTIVPLLGRYNELSYYDNIDMTYDAYHVAKLIRYANNSGEILNNHYKVLKCQDIENDKCNSLFNMLNIDSLDEVIILNMSYVSELKNDSNISNMVKDYVEYIDESDTIILIQNDGYISYIKYRGLSGISDIIKSQVIANNTDTCQTYVEEDGITYISGTKSCIDFNYVWYSGKLWRITAIYPDGTMKMITDDAITTISYGSNVNFYTDASTSSYIYQWLNEDFLSTLYNYENIIVMDASWNATNSNASSTSEVSTKLPETTLVTAQVGLLNSYEYYKSYQNTSSGSGYLNIGYYWWLLNPYSSSSVWTVHFSGSAASGSPSGLAVGARPSIKLQSGITINGGSGTSDDPYTISGDKGTVTANTTFLNTRQSGEYVNFDGELYRIVGIENNTTKLNKMDYVRDESDTVIEKNFSSSTTFGSGTSDTYWDYYLNNTWYDSISETYKNMLVAGTYYLGTTSTNYKGSICATASNTVTTLAC